MSHSTNALTAEDLWRRPDDGIRAELVRGELRIMTPAEFEHGVIIGSLTERLSRHVRENRLGVVAGAETGFVLAENPDTVRAPDIAFVRRERIAGRELTARYFPGPPDLAVEVMSPSDTVEKIDEKTRDWLQHGAAAVWVVSPRSKSVAVHAPGRPPRTLQAGDDLEDAGLLPGFRCQVAALFSID